MSVISIVNQKGGCGKTTTAVNLSACLAIKGYKTLLIDLDPQAHATLGLGVGPDTLDHTIYDVLMQSHMTLNQVLISTEVANLTLAPSNILLSGADIDLVNVIGRENVLRDHIFPVQEEFEFIIIDCSPSLSILTVNALTSSDSVLIPIQTHYYAMEGMRQLFTTIDLVKRRLNPKLGIFGILPTLYDSRTRIAKEVLQGIQDYFKEKVLKTIIHINTKLTEAPSAGEAIIVYDSRSTGARDYTQLADEVLAHHQFQHKLTDEATIARQKEIGVI